MVRCLRSERLLSACLHGDGFCGRRLGIDDDDFSASAHIRNHLQTKQFTSEGRMFELSCHGGELLRNGELIARSLKIRRVFSTNGFFSHEQSFEFIAHGRIADGDLEVTKSPTIRLRQARKFLLGHVGNLRFVLRELIDGIGIGRSRGYRDHACPQGHERIGDIDDGGVRVDDPGCITDFDGRGRSAFGNDIDVDFEGMQRG